MVIKKTTKNVLVLVIQKNMWQQKVNFDVASFQKNKVYLYLSKQRY